MNCNGFLINKGTAMKFNLLKSGIIGLMCLFVFNSAVMADNHETSSDIEKRLSNQMSLSDLLTYAYLTNPSVKASREAWKISIENYRIGTSYPDPQLMTTYFPAPIETRLGPQDWNLTLTQAIPFPGERGQKGRVLEADVKIAKLALDKTVKNMVNEISESFFELIYIQKAEGIARANLNLNQELVKISENAYAHDQGLFYDISKARAQTAQIQYDILLLQELEQTEKARINTLLNRRPDALLGSARELAVREVVYTLDDIYTHSLALQEDVLIADETIQKSDEAIKLSKYESLPSFKIGLFYAAIGEPDVMNKPPNAGDDSVGIQFGVNIPLWVGRNQSQIHKALAARRKASADKEMITNNIYEKISRTWFRLQNSRRLMTLYEKELIPQSMQSVQTAETWYRQGQGSFSDFLEIQATAYNFQLSLARARADYQKALVKLEQLTGMTLDRQMTEIKGDTNS